MYNYLYFNIFTTIIRIDNSLLYFNVKYCVIVADITIRIADAFRDVFLY